MDDVDSVEIVDACDADDADALFVRRSGRQSKRPQRLEEELDPDIFLNPKRSKTSLEDFWEAVPKPKPKKAPSAIPTPITAPALHRPYVPVSRPVFDANEIIMLNQAHPDNDMACDVTSWSCSHYPISSVSQSKPLLEYQRLDIRTPCMALSIHPCGTILAAATVRGEIQLYQLLSPTEGDAQHIYGKWVPIGVLKDDSPVDSVDEFYCISWSPDGRVLFAGGALKSRVEWDQADQDMKILPSPLLAFDTSIVLGSPALGPIECRRYSGHSEELLSIHPLTYKNSKYVISSSQDGHLIKWQFATSDNKDDGWGLNLVSSKQFADNSTWMAFDIAFLPNTGNRYFVVAADTGVKLFDLEHDIVIASWQNLYTDYCDFVKFVRIQSNDDEFSYYLLTRGVEKPQPNKPNSQLRPSAVHMRRLVAPASEAKPEPKALVLAAISGGWSMENVRSYGHERYSANNWPMRATTNNGYVFGPTSSGRIFIWNIHTARLVGVLAAHMQWKGPGTRGGGGGTIRDIVLHPTLPFMLSTAEDGDIVVFCNNRPAPPPKIQPHAVTRAPSSNHNFHAQVKAVAPRQQQPSRAVQPPKYTAAAPVLSVMPVVAMPPIKSAASFAPVVGGPLTVGLTTSNPGLMANTAPIPVASPAVAPVVAPAAASVAAPAADPTQPPAAAPVKRRPGRPRRHPLPTPQIQVESTEQHALLKQEHMVPSNGAMLPDLLQSRDIDEDELSRLEAILQQKKQQLLLKRQQQEQQQKQQLSQPSLPVTPLLAVPELVSPLSPINEDDILGDPGSLFADSM